jgi:hypothetical protein
VSRHEVNNGKTVRERMAEEETIREKVDKHGNRWTKAYFGGGAHFRNWLKQVLELRGEDDVQIEEVNSRGFQCYEESGEKMYRIWIKNDNRKKRDGPP